jgi:pimeloyl-ACP methyl ester carboxylesterase
MARFELPERSVLVAAGLGAVHVLDDNLVEPGLSHSGDHVFSTVVPLLWLAALGALIRSDRIRPGWRALAQIGLGLTLVVLGVEAVYHWSDSGLAGDDVTGLLSLAAGLAMTVAGVRSAWQSRRTDDSQPRRYGRRVAKAAGLLVAGLYLAYPVVEAYVFTNVSSRAVPEDRLDVAHEDVTFEASDGVELSGWYIPSQNGAAVILYPGRGGNQRHARMLADNGYGVLLFDHRGAGDSDGEPNSWGWAGQHDVQGAIDFLQDRPDVDAHRIGALGLSVGGEVLLNTAAIDDRLQAVVSEGAGVRSFEEYREIDDAGARLWDAVAVIRSTATAAFTDRMPPPALHDLLPRIEAPVFFIYATHVVGGESLTPEYHALAEGPKELWQTPGDHTGGLDDDPAEYERRVVGFLDDALGEQSGKSLDDGH